MKRKLHINAMIDQPDILKSLVEKLANRRYELGYYHLQLPKGWRALEPSSTEAYVSGTVGIRFGKGANEEIINMPFITGFLFTCVKSLGGNYNLMWSTSLS